MIGRLNTEMNICNTGQLQEVGNEQNLQAKEVLSSLDQLREGLNNIGIIFLIGYVSHVTNNFRFLIFIPIFMVFKFLPEMDWSFSIPIFTVFKSLAEMDWPFWPSRRTPEGNARPNPLKAEPLLL